VSRFNGSLVCIYELAPCSHFCTPAAVHKILSSLFFHRPPDSLELLGVIFKGGCSLGYHPPKHTTMLFRTNRRQKIDGNISCHPFPVTLYGEVFGIQTRPVGKLTHPFRFESLATFWLKGVVLHPVTPIQFLGNAHRLKCFFWIRTTLGDIDWTSATDP
jgi:hypothetical protein